MKQTTTPTKDESVSAAQRVVEWWKQVQEWPSERARLRRCTTAELAAYGPSFQLLVRMVQPEWNAVESLLPVAAVTSQVREHVSGRSAAKAFATAPPGGRPPLSDLRFRKLMRIEDRADLVPLLRRTTNILDGRIDVADLAESIYYWGDHRKKRWAFDYYATLPDDVKRR